MTDTLLPYRLTALRAYLAKYADRDDEHVVSVRVGLLRGLVACIDNPACGCPVPLCLVCGAGERCATNVACTFDPTYSELVKMLHRRDDEIRRLKEQMDK